MFTNCRAAVTPGVCSTSIVAAGFEWDAVKVPRLAGLYALRRLRSPGAVTVDPASAPPMLYFLVPPRSTAEWDVPCTTALSVGAHVVLPPPHRDGPPGPYWFLAPERGRLCTDTATLRGVLLPMLLSVARQAAVTKEVRR